MSSHVKLAMELFYLLFFAGICAKGTWWPFFMHIRAWFCWCTFLSSVLHRYFAGIMHFDVAATSNLLLKLFYLLFYIAIYAKLAFRPNILWEHDVVGFKFWNWGTSKCHGHKRDSNWDTTTKQREKKRKNERKKRHIDKEMNISFLDVEINCRSVPFIILYVKALKKCFWVGCCLGPL